MYVSVEATRWVFNDSQSERSARLVLLAIAAHCNDDGWAWPGQEALMQFTRLSKPTLLQAIHELERIGEIATERGGNGPRDTNRYYMKAFMEGSIRVKENPSKGKESTLKRVNTGLHEEEELEQEVLEEEIVPVALWLSFVEMRKKIRKPMTSHAGELIRRELVKLRERGFDPVEVLEQSIRNGWQDVYEIRENRNAESFTERRSKGSAQAINRVCEYLENPPIDLRRTLPPTNK